MKIAIIQICSVLDPKENLQKISSLIQKAQDIEQIDAVFLPEVFYSMSDGTKPTPYLIEDNNEHFLAMANLAKKFNIYVLGGSAATKVEDKVINRNYNFSPRGELIETYDKIHLFAVHIRGKDATIINESDVYSAGKDLKMIDIQDFKIGLSICFDLRFPELFREYYKRGANVFSVSSAFTIPTGKAHWLTLLKARAIENQSYVIACNQWGQHNEKLSTYGHSYVIDPWGDVIAECGEGENFAICELKLERLNQIRSRIDMTSRLT